MTSIHSPCPIVSRFIEIAHAYPDNIAIKWRINGTWHQHTYAELLAQSQAVASFLSKSGVKEGQPIIIPSERHPELCAHLIGILWCGAHYVFIDPNYPKERQQFIADATEARFGIATPGSSSLGSLGISWLDTSLCKYDGPTTFDVAGNNELPAYVMFTSGSTGEPKGVVIPQRAILRLVIDTHFISFAPSQVFLQLSALSFDASTLEIWGSLLNGGTCVLHPENGIITPAGIQDVIATQRVTTLWLTASLFNTIVTEHQDALKPIKQLLIGGEALSVPHVRKALAGLPNTSLFNGYGPTENTTFTTVFPIPKTLPDDIKTIPIGYPINGTDCALVDERLNPVTGADQSGELVAFGDGLALGYLKHPKLTNEKFVAIEIEKGRFRTGYRTGDLVKLNKDGSLDYLSRIDKQVKIDGHRIEPGEIEYQLNAVNGIVDARVLVRTGPQGQKRLAAYIVSKTHAQTQAIRTNLKLVFPNYMIPHFIIQVDQLPKTPNGKLDELQLPDPFKTSPKPDQVDIASNTRNTVSKDWQAILNRPVDDTQNFMDAGGTSLEALKLATRLEKSFHEELGATFVFEYPTIKQQIGYFANLANNSSIALNDAQPDKQINEFAIIGMACRFPGASNLKQYWRNLLNGKETVRFFSDQELSQDVSTEERANPAYVRAKGILDGYDCFDAKFFGISPIEARVMDPQQRILLELSWHALEDAGIPPGDSAYRTGVFAGMNWARYYQQYVLPNKELIDSYGALNCGLANEPDSLSTRISYKLNLKGPSVNVFTACSTGLVAVSQACEAIENGQCEQAIAAGVSISTPVQSGYIYQEGSMLSKDGHCRPFDENATGTTFNDGAGAVIIKRRDLAERDGDDIYAVIKGYAVNNDGGQKASFTAPSVAGQVTVYKNALRRANISPASIGFIETHGTATPLGDPIEVLSLKRCYSQQNISEKSCAIGSVKSNIGHTIHAAGLASLIKATLAIRENKIPPTLFFETANSKLELEKSHFFVNTAVEPWRLPSPRRAAVTSLGVGGTNAHVILEEYQSAQEPDLNTEGHPPISEEFSYPLLISAKTKSSLEAQVSQYQSYLNNLADQPEPAPGLSDISHASVYHRKHFNYRAIVFGSDLAVAIKQFGHTPKLIRGKSEANSNQKIVFMFSGQGTQTPHMGSWLYKHSPAYRETFDQGCDIVLNATGVNIKKILFSESLDSDAEQQVNQTSFVQPALFLLEYGLAKYLMARGLQPDLFIGHSIGEYAAAALAGIFSFEDATYLVAQRGILMQGMPPGTMLIVRSDYEAIRALAGDKAEVAAINAPGLVVLSGANEAITELSAELTNRKIANTRLQTSHAFHSSMMTPVVPQFEKLVASAQRNAPSVPIFSTMTGALLSDQEAMSPKYWAQQLRQPVLFSEALQALCHANESSSVSLVEVGPGSTLVTLARSHNKLNKISAHPALVSKGIDKQAENDLFGCIGQLWANGTDIDWHSYFAGLDIKRERLPGYAFAKDVHWLGPMTQKPMTENNTTASKQDIISHVGKQEAKMDSQQHLNKIQSNVMAIIEDVSGYELGDMDPTSHFSEVGLDSLLLTQVATALERQFKIGITFRHLVEDHTSLALVAGFISSRVEPEIIEQPQAQPVQSATMPSADFNLDTETTGLPGNIQEVVNAQLQIMKMQLQALSGGQGVTAPQDVSPDIQTKPTQAKPTQTPATRIAREVSNTPLTSAQKDWVEDLMQKYQQKYAGSKAYTQKHREHLADPRSVSGFNPSWKEIIFPIVTNKSKGSKLWDIDGNEFIDTSNGFGPILFGHSPDFISIAAKEQIDKGVETGPQSPLAGEVADLLCELTGNERCTFACTGSEANVGALRVARTVTGRSTVVAFEGAYHGIHDEVVMRPGKEHKALPAAPGIPREATSNMLLLPWGEQSSLEELRKLGDEIAAVLVEPVQSRKPQFHSQEYISELRKITEENGTALILDEVVTGFRVGPGGIRKRFNVDADMVTYGKVVGGGYPIGIIAGKAKYLDAMDGGQWQYGDDSIPEQGVTFYAGTFVRHPLSLAVAKAVLIEIKDHGDEIYPALEAKTSSLAKDAKAFITVLKSDVSFEEFASLFYISVSQSTQLGHLLFLSMTLDGIHIQQYRPNFLTTAHSDGDVKKILEAFKRALASLVVNGLFAGDQVAAKKYLNGATAIPPGARLGKNEHGEPAYFIEDPDNEGAYKEVGRP